MADTINILNIPNNKGPLRGNSTLVITPAPKFMNKVYLLSGAPSAIRYILNASWTRGGGSELWLKHDQILAESKLMLK